MEQLTLAASGEIIVAAAGDDVSLPSRVARIAEEFSRDRACKYVHSAAIRLDRHSARHEKLESPGRHFFASAARATAAPCLALLALASHRFPPSPAWLAMYGLRTSFWAFVCCFADASRYIDEPLLLYRSDSGITAKPTSRYQRQSRNLAISSSACGCAFSATIPPVAPALLLDGRIRREGAACLGRREGNVMTVLSALLCVLLIHYGRGERRNRIALFSPVTSPWSAGSAWPT